MDTTSEFSFILKPSQRGIGVFATHDIKKGTLLRLFSEAKSRLLPKGEVPVPFRDYPVDRGDQWKCPPDFGAMAVGWYLNHSKNCNAAPGPIVDDDWEYYATRDIAAGEEILIDYNALGEPEDAKEDYYSK